MPRSKKKTKTTAEPMTVGEALQESPIAETLKNQETKAQPEPDPHKEAVATFERQREREQAADLAPLPPRADLPPPQTEVVTSPTRPDRPVKSWAETVRPWSSHGSDTGVHHVTTTSPDMVGIRFDKGKDAPPKKSARWRRLDSAISTKPKPGSRRTGMARSRRRETSPRSSPSAAGSRPCNGGYSGGYRVRPSFKLT